MKDIMNCILNNVHDFFYLHEPKLPFIYVYLKIHRTIPLVIPGRPNLFLDMVSSLPFFTSSNLRLMFYFLLCFLFRFLSFSTLG